MSKLCLLSLCFSFLLSAQLNTGTITGAARRTKSNDSGNFTLQPGSTTQVVSVTASRAVIQTASAENSALLESKQLANTLTCGRDVLSLLRLMPGVSHNSDPNSLGSVIGSSAPNIGGLVGSDADNVNVTVVSFTYDLPAVSKFDPSPVSRAVLDNWHLSGFGSPTVDTARLIGGGDGNRVNVRGLDLPPGTRRLRQCAQGRLPGPRHQRLGHLCLQKLSGRQGDPYRAVP